MTDDRRQRAEAIFAEWQRDQTGDPLNDRDQDTLISAIAEALPLGWQPIEQHPAEPAQVEFYFGNMEPELVLEPYRDERHALGFLRRPALLPLRDGA